MTTPEVGLTVIHRRYIARSEAHYGGGLMDAAYVLGLFGDAATELCIRTDRDEGLLAGYEDARFLAPVQAGDVLEVTATVDQVGRRSRRLRLEARVTCRSAPDRGESAADVLDPPLVVVTARATVVVPTPTGQPERP